MKKLDGKSRAAGEREENGGSKAAVVVGLIDESEIPATTRAGKESALTQTVEFRGACEILMKGIPEKKALRIPLSEDTLKLGKNPKGTAIGFKRHLVAHAKKMSWKVNVSLKGTELFVKADSKKSK
jgi:hypothetical protein